MGIIVRILDDETGELSRVELTSDLGISFLDRNIEYDIMFSGMGGEKNFFCRVLELWEQHPMAFLCGNNVVSVTKLGIASCALVLDAMLRVNHEQPVNCFDPTKILIETCRRQWGKRRYEASRLYNNKQDLIRCWNKHVQDKPPPSFGERAVVDAALYCFDMVISYWLIKETVGGYADPPRFPCDIAERAREAVAAMTWGVKTYGWDFGSFTVDPIGFQMVLNTMPPELATELQRIERQQASVAIGVLEKLP